VDCSRLSGYTLLLVVYVTEYIVHHTTSLKALAGAALAALAPVRYRYVNPSDTFPAPNPGLIAADAHVQEHHQLHNNLITNTAPLRRRFIFLPFYHRLTITVAVRHPRAIRLSRMHLASLDIVHTFGTH
jgi:hypothetical protein